MKYEVIRRFRDKYTGEIILPGATFICDEADRIKDLTDRGIIKKQDLNPDEMTKKEDGDWRDYLQKYPATKEYLSSYTKKELQVMLGEKGIEYNQKQTKTELVKLLGGDE
jgi:heme oxygenase